MLQVVLSAGLIRVYNFDITHIIYREIQAFIVIIKRVVKDYIKNKQFIIKTLIQNTNGMNCWSFRK